MLLKRHENCRRKMPRVASTKRRDCHALAVVHKCPLALDKAMFMASCAMAREAVRHGRRAQQELVGFFSNKCVTEFFKPNWHMFTMHPMLFCTIGANSG